MDFEPALVDQYEFGWDDNYGILGFELYEDLIIVLVCRDLILPS